MLRFIKQSLTQFRFHSVSARSPPKYSARKAWSIEDDQILKEARACNRSWLGVAQSLPDRTPDACARRFARLAPSIAHDLKSIRRRSRPWTEDENRLLREKVAQYGFRWKFLSDSYFPNRSPPQLYGHWVTVGNPRQKSGAWLPEEEKRLLDAIQNDKLSWPAVAERVGTRNQMQCWHKYICMSQLIKKGLFSNEEDKAILDAFKIHPNDWGEIASVVDKTTGFKRLPGQCKIRYQRYLDPKLAKDTWTAEEEKILVDAYNRYGTNFSAISQLLPHYRSGRRVQEHIRMLIKRGVIEGHESKNESQERNGEELKIE
ncbi:hypothetical protein BC936DRAFT_143553 [Jimgerdemannia flammicorona]|uniref:Homeodomain-like protein n=1 Tax=Jimgerdemannia flammicorona TaxID=994334 RepID=A0A433DDR3_9FUNG|nr:hypothetical protein BC936DRAFT_143553 [Jimgerdemannia flammicorona]